MTHFSNQFALALEIELLNGVSKIPGKLKIVYISGNY